jgi:hypothetical protein
MHLFSCNPTISILLARTTFDVALRPKSEQTSHDRRLKNVVAYKNGFVELSYKRQLTDS